MKNVEAFVLVCFGDIIHTREGGKYIKLSGNCATSVTHVAPGLLCEVGTGNILCWFSVLDRWPGGSEYSSKNWWVEARPDVQHESKSALRKLEPFLKHELLDRVYLIADMFENYVLEHDAAHYPTVTNQVLDISGRLWKLYQAVANLPGEDE